MPSNISIAQCKMIAISCLQGRERERVMQEWNERFQEREAFWLDAQAGQKAGEMVKAIADMVRAQGITALNGQTLVMAVFLDLTREPDEALLGEIVKVPQRLTSALGCMVPLTLEFGYLAVKAFGDADSLKANVQKTVDINCQNPNQRKQLCLVAVSPLWQQDEDVSWKAVMVCLDLLRRNTAPATMVPVEGATPCNNVGFLRYGEFDQDRRRRLLAEKERLDHALSSNGAIEFKGVVSMALGKIESDVVARYAVDGNSHPIHPGMYPEGFFDKRKAARGQEPFASARNSTWHALDMTGKQLKETILESYREQIGNAAVYLGQYIKEAGIGIDLESDQKQMLALLEPEPIGMAEPMTPNLAYMETGYASVIDDYLKSVRRYAGAKARYEFAKALKEAYLQIPVESYNQRKADLQQKRKNVNEKLNMLMTQQQLINMVAMGSELPGSAFSITRAVGTSAYWAVCRDLQIGEAMDKALMGTMATGFFIDATYGGLKLLDNAPLKAVQLLQFNCNDACLEDLIG